jgi:hypothetical protein
MLPLPPGPKDGVPILHKSCRGKPGTDKYRYIIVRTQYVRLRSLRNVPAVPEIPASGSPKTERQPKSEDPPGPKVGI